MFADLPDHLSRSFFPRVEIHRGIVSSYPSTSSQSRCEIDRTVGKSTNPVEQKFRIPSTRPYEPTPFTTTTTIPGRISGNPQDTQERGARESQRSWCGPGGAGATAQQQRTSGTPSTFKRKKKKKSNLDSGFPRSLVDGGFVGTRSCGGEIKRDVPDRSGPPWQGPRHIRPPGATRPGLDLAHPMRGGNRTVPQPRQPHRHPPPPPPPEKLPACTLRVLPAWIGGGGGVLHPKDLA
ncbi:hypothetical protein BDP81DRAFT_191239 [Colletotrichum phormii]|uniref:Uncharacterized protein n=1 Tax=Colletotrichum phormii TaxID=359342 RepID=A0AAI9ZVU8_9PEZI|nr:uncharacterized protein BDP81DRAFT_191239 [Colletotrichum phormii]KAK1638775.1 hypothetical protein BDP81DRAFT_191239 [Colletotrichum phormii]